MRRSAWVRIGGAVIGCGVLLAACSSSSSSSAASTPAEATSAAPSSSSFSSTGSPVSSSTVDGKWNGSYTPSGGGSGDFSVTFTQTGSSLDGTLSISVACLDGALARRLARGRQLIACALGKGLHADRREQIMSRAQLHPRIHAPTLSTQPLPIQQVSPTYLRP